MPVTTLKRKFSLADQERFATVSGDRNPIHMDPVVARRTQAGAPVVHGIHVLLWVLDEFARADMAVDRIVHVRVQFIRFMYLDVELEVNERESSAAFRRFIVSSGGLALMTVSLRQGNRRSEIQRLPSLPLSGLRMDAADLTHQEIANRSGRLAPPATDDLLVQLFPHAAQVLGWRRVLSIAQSSYLIGMVCPGLHSIFAKLDLDFLAEVSSQLGLEYSSEFDERFRIASLQILGPGVAGTATAFVRYPPIESKSISEMASLTVPAEFSGITALIVGGSRGLGAATAKLIVAGGGRAIITYAQGRVDAERLARELNSFGATDRCDVMQLDILDSAQLDLSRLRGQVTELYYFATPKIFNQGSGVFSPALFFRFLHAYVIAFSEICNSLLSDDLLRVFYPSSIAIDQRPKGMTEYAMAKSAGEIFCADLNRAKAKICIRVERLPRILTDQTATIAGASSADATDVMLQVLRSMAR